MGVYGYGTAGMAIPEGYLDVKVDVDGQEVAIDIPYPANPGSIYHMTKTLDALLFYYYNKNDSLRITDLHQGIVWGTNTDETLAPTRRWSIASTTRATTAPSSTGFWFRPRRPSADGLRYGRPDARFHQHPRYGALRQAGSRESAGPR
jgi:nucleoside-diphosphate-sugar epimerase